MSSLGWSRSALKSRSTKQFGQLAAVIFPMARRGGAEHLRESNSLNSSCATLACKGSGTDASGVPLRVTSCSRLARSAVRLIVESVTVMEISGSPSFSESTPT
jgi:hypothetical protein